MTNKQEMIDTIYEEIADKILSFGCIIKDPSDQLSIVIQQTEKFMDTLYITGVGGKIGKTEGFGMGGVSKNCDYKIIGHPIMIGDVLDWLEKNMKVIYNYEGHLGAEISGDILTKRIYKRKPIEDQSEECIKYIYDLVTNK